MRQRPLDVLLTRNSQKILAAMLMHPERWWYRSELANQMGASPSSLQRPLSALIDAGLLRSRRHGNRLYVQANPDNPLYPELRGLVTKTIGLVDVLRRALSPLDRKIIVAFVYGSVARGQEVNASDVDLFVIGTAGLADLAAPLRTAQELLSREVNATTYSEKEFVKKIQARHHFIMDVLSSPKLFIMGSENELGRITGAAPGREKGRRQK